MKSEQSSAEEERGAQHCCGNFPHFPFPFSLSTLFFTLGIFAQRREKVK